MARISLIVRGHHHGRPRIAMPRSGRRRQGAEISTSRSPVEMLMLHIGLFDTYHYGNKGAAIMAFKSFYGGWLFYKQARLIMGGAPYQWKGRPTCFIFLER